MGDGLDGCHTDECGDIQIGDVELIAMSFEIAANKCVRFALDSLDVFQPSGTRRLLGEHAVKLRADGWASSMTETSSRPRPRSSRRHLDQGVADRCIIWSCGGR